MNPDERMELVSFLQSLLLGRWQQAHRKLLQISAFCQHCDVNQRLNLPDVLVVWADWNRATVTAPCTECGEVLAQPVENPFVLQALHDIGCTESFPPGDEEKPGGPPLSHDDLLAFHNALYGQRSKE
jgi:hypothetical protein